MAMTRESSVPMVGPRPPKRRRRRRRRARCRAAPRAHRAAWARSRRRTDCLRMECGACRATSPCSRVSTRNSARSRPSPRDPARRLQLRGRRSKRASSASARQVRRRARCPPCARAPDRGRRPEHACQRTPSSAISTTCVFSSISQRSRRGYRFRRRCSRRSDRAAIVVRVERSRTPRRAPARTITHDRACA